MQRKLFLLSMLVSVLFLSTQVNAKSYTVDGTLGAGGSYSTSNDSLLGDYYKYIKIEFTPKKDAKFYVSLIGASNVSSLGHADALNPSIELSADAGSTKVIYILPRSGMSCPAGADYCFGTGTNYSKTTVVQGNECNGKMCNIYGIRIKNKRLFTSYDFTMKYEFVK